MGDKHRSYSLIRSHQKESQCLASFLRNVHFHGNLIPGSPTPWPAPHLHWCSWAMSSWASRPARPRGHSHSGQHVFVKRLNEQIYFAASEPEQFLHGMFTMLLSDTAPAQTAAKTTAIATRTNTTTTTPSLHTTLGVGSHLGLIIHTWKGRPVIQTRNDKAETRVFFSK